MRNMMKKKLAGLLFGSMLALMGWAGAASFTTTGDSPVVCPGDVTIEANGAVKCKETGAALLSSCAADIVFDSTGAIRCTAAEATVAPACALTAAPSSISAGASSTLSASCTPAATSYLWSGTGFASNASGGSVSPSGSTTYSVRGVNAAGTGASASVAVTVTGGGSSTPPTAPPTCTLTNGSGSFVQGMTDTLTVNCTPAATSYAWSANAGCASTSASCAVAPTMTTTYTVTGSNSMGTGNVASTTVTKSTACTLTATPSSIVQGAASTLTASCSPAANDYTWTGGTCAGVTVNTCTVTPAANTSYTVVGNITGSTPSTPVSATVTVVPPSCTLTANPDSVGLGGSTTLTANCSPAATGYTWTGGACVGNLTNTCTDTPAVTTIYAVTGTGTNTATSSGVTVTVVPPYCTVTANPTSVIPGGSTTLTASCSPAATGYTWTGGTCAGNLTNTCTDTLAATTTYAATGTGTNTATSPGVTVTVTPPSCTLTASPASIIPGGSSTLTATCSPAATSYTWTGGTCAGTAGNSCVVTPAATTTYTVTGASSAGSGNTASAPVTVSALQCSIVNVSWSWGGLDLNTIPQMSLGNGQAVAYQVVIPDPYTMHYAGVSYNTVPAQIEVSSSPCTWSASKPACGAVGSLPQIAITGGADSSACQVSPGSTYYFNVKNANVWNGPDTCAAGQTCTHYLSW